MLFDSVIVKRVDQIDWLARVATPEPVSAGAWRTRQLEDFAAAKGHLAEWRLEIGEALADLQFFFYANAREHHEHWNSYIDEANAVLRTNVRPRLDPVLDAGNYDKLRRNLVMSEVKVALIEIQFRDLGTPRFFENLPQVYEAGHLPCGWKGVSPPEVPGRRAPVAQYFPSGTLLYL